MRVSGGGGSNTGRIGTCNSWSNASSSRGRNGSGRSDGGRNSSSGGSDGGRSGGSGCGGSRKNSGSRGRSIGKVSSLIVIESVLKCMEGNVTLVNCLITRDSLRGWCLLIGELVPVTAKASRNGRWGDIGAPSE